MVDSKEIISKASKGYIEKYYNSANKVNGTDKFGAFPVFDRDKALEAIRQDSTIISAITTLVDKSVNKGWKVLHKKTRKRLDTLRFNNILRKTFYNIYGYGNTFIENVKKGKELHLLETTITEPLTDEHGKIYGYQQLVPKGQEGEPTTWTVNEVTHIASTTLTTGVWGELDIQSIYTLVLIKQYIKSYIGWLFGTNQFRPFYNIKDANDEQVKSFLSYLRKSENNIQHPLIAEGTIEAQVLRDFSDGTTILQVWEKCDRDIMTLFQTSPINMGQPGDSNRSSSDGQGKADDIHVRSIQKLVADEINFDLFPKIGINDEFSFLEVDDNKIEKLLGMAERMNNMGFKKVIIEEYLHENDFPIEGTLFDPNAEQETKVSMDMQPSRKGKDSGDGNKKIGTGKESTTREDQLVSKAYSGATFNIYEDDE